MTKAVATKKLVAQFEDALADLIEIYIRDGLPPDAVNRVLKARADDDYRSFGVGMEFPDRPTNLVA